MNRHQELPVKDPNDNTLRFFVIGDFGAYFDYREFLSATDAINDLTIQYVHDHIVTVGDNIYWKGIEIINIRWQLWLTFSVFKKSALKNIIVYQALENHDCYVDMFNEVKYSKYDYQWRLESEYYAKVTLWKTIQTSNLLILCSTHVGRSVRKEIRINTIIMSEPSLALRQVAQKFKLTKTR